MQLERARWERAGMHTWILKAAVKDGSAVYGRIEQTAGGYAWETFLDERGHAPSYHEAQRAARKALRLEHSNGTHP